MTDFTDQIGDALRALPRPVQTVIAFALFGGMGALMAYAIMTPDPICVGCP